MTSKIEMCNMAIGHVRGASITSLTERTNEARYCNLYYDPARKFVLEAHPWKFANKVAALALLEEVPQQWFYSYAQPSDCLSIRRLLSEVVVNSNGARDLIYRLDYYGHDYEAITREKIAYDVGLNEDGSTAIWTNQENAYISYTMNQESTSRFPSAFVMGFSHYLASLIAVPIAGRKEGEAIARDQLALYASTMAQAQVNNMFERYKGPPRESDMVTVRA